MKKRITIQLLAAFICFGQIHLYGDGDGGQAGAFLRYGVGVRAMGMGRAFTAVSDDASAVYWNPAGMLGAERAEVASMYSNLFYDSRYAFLGLTLPRLVESDESSWKTWFFGPNTAIGTGWIGLSMVGFEQRTAYNEYLGQFDMGENAWFLSWARETVNSHGIFRYGLTYKLVNQQFPGLSGAAMNVGDTGTDWSGGFDAGVTFKPINAPVFRIAALRYLLPLQLGMSIQNLIQPGWQKLDRVTENGSKKGGVARFPMVFRYGFSYRMLLRDWTPDDWNIKSGLGDAAVLLALDREHYKGAGNGTYFGMEGQIPVHAFDVWLNPRLGVNNRSEGLALGFGMSVPFANAVLKVDYGHVNHPDMSGDTRFSIAVQFRPPKHAGYFKTMAGLRDKEANNHLVISKYPNAFVEEAVNEIAMDADRAYKKRLYQLIGGLRYAELLLEDAQQHLKDGEISDARKKALESGTIFQEHLNISGEYGLTDEQTVQCGTALMIANEMEKANDVIKNVDQWTIHGKYIEGMSYIGMHSPVNAALAFNDGVKLYQDQSVKTMTEEEVSLLLLSLLGMGEAMVRQQDSLIAGAAMVTLSSVVNFGPKKLHDDYPRYPIIEDNYVVDDALFLLGLTEILNNEYEKGVATLQKVHKDYRFLYYGIEVLKYFNLITGAPQRLADNDPEVRGELKSLAQELLIEYLIKHYPDNSQFQ
jgi:hypothetical protein